MPRKRKRYKQPNGKGSIAEYKRADGSTWFRVRKAGIMLPNGTYYRESLGTYSTYDEAYKVLIEGKLYGSDNMTLYEFFEMWTNSKKFERLGDGTRKEYKRNILKFEPIIYMPIKDIKFYMLQNKVYDLINDGYYVEENGTILHKDYKPSTLRKIVATIKKAYQYAENNEAIQNNITNNLDITTDVKSEPYSPIDLDFLEVIENRAKIDTRAKIVLVNIYTGLRPSEMCNLAKKHVFFEEGYIHGMGVKTDNGKNRKIPILKKIEKYLKELYISTNEFIVGNKMNPKQYRNNILYPLMKELGYEKAIVAYSCRHTFANILNNSNVDKEVIKQVMGHASYVTTSDYYIDEDINKSIFELNSKIAN